MHYALGNHHSLTRPQSDGPVFQINRQFSLDHIEELIIHIVLVPVIFSLHYTQPDHGIIYATKRLVVPLMRAGIRQGFFIDQLQRTVLNIEVGYVRVVFWIANWNSIISYLANCLYENKHCAPGAR